ncbi:MAG: 5-keto-L-gluconate epimerase [Desulfobacterales bacterium]|nr:5-keto-L-gluconate epimerase [Desulfobacterales bacterium]
MMQLSIVLSTHQASFDAVAFKGDLAANVAQIASMGYDGVELAIRDPKLVDPGEILELMAEHQLTVPAIGTGQAWGEEKLSLTDPDASIRQRAIERLESHIPLAAKLKAKIIVGLIRGIGGLSDSQKEEQWLVEGLQHCLEKAASHGVKIALEPLNRYETTLIHTVSQGVALIDKIGVDNMGLLLDTFHMNIEEPSINASIKSGKDSIFHFHVADSNRWHPGAGHLDFADILTTLYSTGYQGFVSGEFMPIPDAPASAARAIEYLRGLKLSASHSH